MLRKSEYEKPLTTGCKWIRLEVLESQRHGEGQREALRRWDECSCRRIVAKFCRRVNSLPKSIEFSAITISESSARTAGLNDNVCK